MADKKKQRKLTPLAVIQPTKSIADMTDQEIDLLADDLFDSLIQTKLKGSIE